MLLLVIAILILVLCYAYSTRNHDYWAKRNVKYEKPLPFFGNHLPIMLFKKNINEAGIELYNKYGDEKFVGTFRGNTPELLVKDPDILKCILNLEFNHFFARGLDLKPKKDSLWCNLFFVNGDHWRLLRKRFPAAFSTSKLRGMFPLVAKCAEKLQDTTKETIEQSDIVYTWELMARFTIEFIGSCGFGIDLHTIGKENGQFLELAKAFFDKTELEMFAINFNDIVPILNYIPGSFGIKKDFVRIIKDVSKRVSELRNFKPSGRNDFMDILLEMFGMGKVYAESFFLKNADGSPVQVEHEMDEHGIAASVFLFFVGGFETSALTTSSLLHLLAYHQEIQKRVQSEIDCVLAKYNNKLSYDALKELTLLDMCLKETMRILPPASFIRRTCMKQYTVPNTNITIDPGVRILIPLQALHMDSKFFDDPHEFRPERFSPDTCKERYSYVYMPFGEGPRKCPGE